MRAAFVFDADRCTGCEACRVACGIENNEGRDNGWRTIVTFNPSRHPALPTRHLSLACNHCDTTPCASGCPAAAYERDEKTGAVILDPAKCIGCRYCSWLCPYDAPKYDEDRGLMTKCTFCAPRLAQGGQPACAAACPTGALSLGMREAGEDEPSFHGLASLGLGPSLRIEKTRRADPPPALAIDDLVLDAPPQSLPARKITIRSEWVLLLFTIAMPALVAWLGGGIVLPERRPPLPLFLMAGAAALALSAFHLGRPSRAWRALLNLRTSWLSREIFFANVFLLSGAVFLAIPRGPSWTGLLALASGIALTVSIDEVYRAIPRSELRHSEPRRRRGIPRGFGAGGGSHALYGARDDRRMHSSEAVLTFLLLLGIAANVPIVTIPAALLTVALFGGRWWRGEAGVPDASGATRVLLLVLACIPSIAWPLAFALALIGEVIDRAAFYGALEPTSPGQRMAMEMRAAF